MGSDNDYQPKLRNVEPVPLVVRGQPAVGLKDPLGLADRMLCVPRDVLHVVALMDGEHTLRDIQTELTLRSGRLVFSDDIKAIVDKLDNVFLLESDRYRQAFARKVAEYRKSPYRPASHAGISYSDDPAILTSELDAFFTGENGPGKPELFSDTGRPVGLVAPHIDIRSGGNCFAHAYHALSTGQPSDVYVVFGTGHSGVDGLFTATNLDFQTPLGKTETDREFLAALSKELGRDPCAEEILHANEHVIEFQVIFLQHVFLGRHSFTIVPVLCSLSHLFFEDDPAYRSRREEFEYFCRAVKETCAKSSRSICFIASADLDHIGPRYGDTFMPHRGTVTEALERDRELIGFLEKLDVQGFITGVARDNDSRRICGFSPITTMLHCMEADSGSMLTLDYTHVDDQQSFVSFTSMVFH